MMNRDIASAQRVNNESIALSVPIQADNKLGKVCCLWGPLMLRQAHDDPYKGDGAGISGEEV